MFSIRIVTTSPYQATPIPGLDVTHSDFRESKVNKVPVLRIFGATPAGQKTCMHVHGVFPYLYVPYDGTQPLDRYMRQFATSLDKAINIGNRIPNSNIQHVFKISLVSGIPMYGYHREEGRFLKIYLYNPNNIRKAADLLLGGAVMNKPFQPHEAHLPFPLQLFIDFNLYGMNMVCVGALKFRQKSSGNERKENDGDGDGSSSPPSPSSSSSFLSAPTPILSVTPPNTSSSSSSTFSSNTVWDKDSIPSEFWHPACVERQSMCELEVDVVAADIINRQDLTNNVGTNPGLAALWDDERQRRREAGLSSQIIEEDSQEREGIDLSESEQKMLERFSDMVRVQQELRNSLSMEEEEEETDDSQTTVAASQVERHLSREDSVGSSQGTVILGDQEDEGGGDEWDHPPIVSLDSIQKVVASSQSFHSKDSQRSLSDTQDLTVAGILAAILDEDTGTPSSQVTALEERDSILNTTVVLNEEDEREEEEETVLMSQSVGGNQSRGNDDAVNEAESRSPDVIMNTDDEGDNDDDEGDNDDDDEGSDDDDDDFDDIDLLPQFDGASDKMIGRPSSSQNATSSEGQLGMSSSDGAAVGNQQGFQYPGARQRGRQGGHGYPTVDASWSQQETQQQQQQMASWHTQQQQAGVSSSAQGWQTKTSAWGRAQNPQQHNYPHWQQHQHHQQQHHQHHQQMSPQRHQPYTSPHHPVSPFHSPPHNPYASPPLQSAAVAGAHSHPANYQHHSSPRPSSSTSSSLSSTPASAPLVTSSSTSSSSSPPSSSTTSSSSFPFQSPPYAPNPADPYHPHPNYPRPQGYGQYSPITPGTPTAYQSPTGGGDVFHSPPSSHAYNKSPSHVYPPNHPYHSPVQGTINNPADVSNTSTQVTNQPFHHRQAVTSGKNYPSSPSNNGSNNQNNYPQSSVPVASQGFRTPPVCQGGSHHQPPSPAYHHPYQSPPHGPRYPAASPTHSSSSWTSRPNNANPINNTNPYNPGYSFSPPYNNPYPHHHHHNNKVPDSSSLCHPNVPCSSDSDSSAQGKMMMMSSPPHLQAPFTTTTSSSKGGGKKGSSKQADVKKGIPTAQNRGYARAVAPSKNASSGIDKLAKDKIPLFEQGLEVKVPDHDPIIGGLPVSSQDHIEGRLSNTITAMEDLQNHLDRMSKTVNNMGDIAEKKEELVSFLNDDMDDDRPQIGTESGGGNIGQLTADGRMGDSSIAPNVCRTHMIQAPSAASTVCRTPMIQQLLMEESPTKVNITPPTVEEKSTGTNVTTDSAVAVNQTIKQPSVTAASQMIPNLSMLIKGKKKTWKGKGSKQAVRQRSASLSMTSGVQGQGFTPGGMGVLKPTMPSQGMVSGRSPAMRPHSMSTSGFPSHGYQRKTDTITGGNKFCVTDRQKQHSHSEGAQSQHQQQQQQQQQQQHFSPVNQWQQQQHHWGGQQWQQDYAMSDTMLSDGGEGEDGLAQDTNIASSRMQQRSYSADCAGQFVYSPNSSSASSSVIGQLPTASMSPQNSNKSTPTHVIPDTSVGGFIDSGDENGALSSLLGLMSNDGLWDEETTTGLVNTLGQDSKEIDNLLEWSSAAKDKPSSETSRDNPPETKDFITLEPVHKSRSGSDATGMTSSEESDRMDYEIAADLIPSKVPNVAGTTGSNYQAHPRAVKQTRMKSMDMLCRDIVTADNTPTYTYTFHVPTPLFKRLKFYQSAEARKHDLKVLRMHPMDARKYSLMKIGKEVVNVVKLSERDLAKYNVTLPLPDDSYHSMADGLFNRVNLDIPPASSSSSDEGPSSLSSFETDFPPNKVAPPSTLPSNRGLLNSRGSTRSSTPPSSSMASHSPWPRQYPNNNSQAMGVATSPSRYHHPIASDISTPSGSNGGSNSCFNPFPPQNLTTNTTTNQYPNVRPQHTHPHPQYPVQSSNDGYMSDQYLYQRNGLSMRNDSTQIFNGQTHNSGMASSTPTYTQDSNFYHTGAGSYQNCYNNSSSMSYHPYHQQQQLLQTQPQDGRLDNGMFNPNSNPNSIQNQKNGLRSPGQHGSTNTIDVTDRLSSGRGDHEDDGGDGDEEDSDAAATPMSTSTATTMASTVSHVNARVNAQINQVHAANCSGVDDNVRVRRSMTNKNKGDMDLLQNSKNFIPGVDDPDSFNENDGNQSDSITHADCGPDIVSPRKYRKSRKKRNRRLSLKKLRNINKADNSLLSPSQQEERTTEKSLMSIEAARNKITDEETQNEWKENDEEGEKFQEDLNVCRRTTDLVTKIKTDSGTVSAPSDVPSSGKKKDKNWKSLRLKIPKQNLIHRNQWADDVARNDSVIMHSEEKEEGRETLCSEKDEEKEDGEEKAHSDSSQGFRQSMRQAKMRSVQQKHEFDMARMKDSKRKRRSLKEGVHYIVVGKFKGHQQMMVKIPRVGVCIGQVVNADRFVQSCQRDVVRMVGVSSENDGDDDDNDSGVDSNVNSAKTSVEIVIENNDEGETKEESNRDEGMESIQVNTNQSENCNSLQIDSQNSTADQPVSCNSLQMDSQDSTADQPVSCNLLQVDSQDSPADQPVSCNLLQVDSQDSTAATSPETPFFCRLKKTFIKRQGGKGWVNVSQRSRLKNVFFPGVQARSFVRFQATFHDNIAKLVDCQEYSSSSDDEDDFLDDIILKGKVQQAKEFGLFKDYLVERLTQSETFSLASIPSLIPPLETEDISTDEGCGEIADGDSIMDGEKLSCSNQQGSKTVLRTGVTIVPEDEDIKNTRIMVQEKNCEDKSMHLENGAKNTCGGSKPVSNRIVGDEDVLDLNSVSKKGKNDGLSNFDIGEREMSNIDSITATAITSEEKMSKKDEFDSVNKESRGSNNGKGKSSSENVSQLKESVEDRKEFIKRQMAFYEDISSDGDTDDTIVDDGHVTQAPRLPLPLLPYQPINLYGLTWGMTLSGGVNTTVSQPQEGDDCQRSLNGGVEQDGGNHNRPESDVDCNAAMELYEQDEASISKTLGDLEDVKMVKLEKVKEIVSCEANINSITTDVEKIDPETQSSEEMVEKKDENDLPVGDKELSKDPGMVTPVVPKVELTDENKVSVKKDEPLTHANTEMVSVSAKPAFTKANVKRKKRREMELLGGFGTSSNDEKDGSLYSTTTKRLRQQKDTKYTYGMSSSSDDDNNYDDPDVFLPHSQTKLVYPNKKQTQANKDKGRPLPLAKNPMEKRPARRGRRKKGAGAGGNKLFNSLSLLHMATLANLTESQDSPSSPPSRDTRGEGVLTSAVLYTDRANSDYSRDYTSSLEAMSFTTPPEEDEATTSPPLPFSPAEKLAQQIKGQSKVKETTASSTSRRYLNFANRNNRNNRIRPGCNGSSNLGTRPFALSHLINSSASSSPIPANFFSSEPTTEQQPGTGASGKTESNTKDILEYEKAKAVSISMKQILKMSMTDDSMDSDSKDGMALFKPKESKRAQVKSTALSMSDIMKLTCTNGMEVEDNIEVKHTLLPSGREFFGDCGGKAEVKDVALSFKDLVKMNQEAGGDDHVDDSESESSSSIPKPLFSNDLGSLDCETLQRPAIETPSQDDKNASFNLMESSFVKSSSSSDVSVTTDSSLPKPDPSPSTDIHKELSLTPDTDVDVVDQSMLDGGNLSSSPSMKSEMDAKKKGLPTPNVKCLSPLCCIIEETQISRTSHDELTSGEPDIVTPQSGGRLSDKPRFGTEASRVLSYSPGISKQYNDIHTKVNNLSPLDLTDVVIESSQDVNVKKAVETMSIPLIKESLVDEPDSMDTDIGRNSVKENSEEQKLNNTVKSEKQSLCPLQLPSFSVKSPSPSSVSASPSSKSCLYSGSSSTAHTHRASYPWSWQWQPHSITEALNSPLNLTSPLNLSTSSIKSATTVYSPITPTSPISPYPLPSTTTTSATTIQPPSSSLRNNNNNKNINIKTTVSPSPSPAKKPKPLWYPWLSNKTEATGNNSSDTTDKMDLNHKSSVTAMAKENISNSVQVLDQKSLTRKKSQHFYSHNSYDNVIDYTKVKDKTNEQKYDEQCGKIDCAQEKLGKNFNKMSSSVSKNSNSKATKVAEEMKTSCNISQKNPRCLSGCESISQFVGSVIDTAYDRKREASDEMKHGNKYGKWKEKETNHSEKSLWSGLKQSSDYHRHHRIGRIMKKQKPNGFDTESYPNVNNNSKELTDDWHALSQSFFRNSRHYQHHYSPSKDITDYPCYTQPQNQTFDSSCPVVSQCSKPGLVTSQSNLSQNATRKREDGRVRAMLENERALRDQFGLKSMNNQLPSPNKNSSLSSSHLTDCSSTSNMSLTDRLVVQLIKGDNSADESKDLVDAVAAASKKRRNQKQDNQGGKDEKSDSTSSRKDNCNSGRNDEGSNKDGKKDNNKRRGEDQEREDCSYPRHSSLPDDTSVVISPVKRPPSRLSVETSLMSHCLNSVQVPVAFCSSLQDVPDRPMDSGGRVLVVASKRLSELKEFDSCPFIDGIKTHRSRSLASSSLLPSQSNKPLTDLLDHDPAMRFMFGPDGPVIIAPCRLPPKRKTVAKWLHAKLMEVSKGKEKVQFSRGRNQTKLPSIEGENSQNETKKPKRRSVMFSQMPSQKDSPEHDIISSSPPYPASYTHSPPSPICSLLPGQDESMMSIDTDLDISKSPSQTPAPIPPTPESSKSRLGGRVAKKRKTPNQAASSTSTQSMSGPDVNDPKADGTSYSSSTPLRRSSNDLFESCCTPIGLSPDIGQDRSTLLTVKEGNDGDASPSQILKRISTNTEMALRKNIFASQPKRQFSNLGFTAGEVSQIEGPTLRNSFGFKVAMDNLHDAKCVHKRQFSNLGFTAGEVSQIEGPTLRNSFGFKVAMDNLHDAKCVHKYQCVTTMSVEVHVETRGDLRPNPEFDAVKAIFYSIFNDVPEGQGRRNTKGVIMVDPESWQVITERQKRLDSMSAKPSQSSGSSPPTPSTPKRLATQTPTSKGIPSSPPSSSYLSSSSFLTQKASTPRPQAHSPKPSTSKARSPSPSPTKSPRGKRKAKVKPSPVPKIAQPELAKTLLERCGVDSDLEVIYVQDETDLMLTFEDLVHRCDPDILVGFEIQMLSWGYLFQRAATLNIALCSKIARVPGAKENNTFSVDKDQWGADHMSEIHVVGRIVLNLWRILRHEVSLNTYTFENCAYHILHQRVPLFSFRDLTKWFTHDKQRWRVVDFYVTRVDGQLRMIDQLDLIGKTSEFSRVFGIEFYDVLARGTQIRVESMMLRLAKPMNYVAVSPSVQQRARQRAPECIALTLEPESKYYTSPVVVLDFQSLYPSIMIAYNYCFSTCLGRMDFLDKANDGPIEFGCTSLPICPKLLKKFRSKVTISPNGIAFVKPSVRKGVLSKMVEEILNTRIMVKKSMKDCKDDKTLTRMLDARQLGLKLIANVTYGYTAANFSGRMPCVEVADSIVRKARESLERAIKLVEDTPRWGAKVVYGDTDSMFLHFPGRSKDEAFVLGHEIADAVTSIFPKPMKLKFEKVYLPCVLQTKKRYVGFSYETPDQKDPVFDAKGIETVRRDSCSAVSKILERSIKVLFSTHDLSRVKTYVCRQLHKLLEGRVSLLDLIFAKEFRGMMGYKPGACVPSLEIARKRLRVDPCAEPRVGDRVPYVIVHGSPGLPLIQLVREPQELIKDRTLRLNAVYYITKQILPPLDRLFSLIGVDVFKWYREMPKVVRVGHIMGMDSSNKQGTISQFFATSNCPVCDVQTKTPVCGQCRKDPQLVVTTLNAKMREWEATYNKLSQVCTTCQGIQDTDQPCCCVDCPILYRRHVARQDLHRADTLTTTLNKYLLDF